MKKFDTLVELLYKIYLILKQYTDQQRQLADTDEVMTRQQVKDYLNISESTYKRKVKDGTLKPIRTPGGHRFYKNELLASYHESVRRGRI